MMPNGLEIRQITNHKGDSKNGKVKMEWEIKKEGNKLYIMLNNGINKILYTDHKDFINYLAEVKSEINYYRSFTKTTVKGEELLEIASVN